MVASMPNDDLARLHQELADVKTLLHQLAHAQGLPAGHQAAGTADACQQAGRSQGPKASVHLEMPQEEQQHHSSSTDLTGPQHQPLPTSLCMLGHGIKPSIQEAVMRQCAAHAAHHASDYGSDGHASRPSPSSQSSSQQDAEADQIELKNTCCDLKVEPFSAAVGCDAAVHITTTTGNSKEQQHQQQEAIMQEQQPAGKLAGGWPTQTGACREVDMLAKRVHANMEAPGAEELIQPQAPPATTARCLAFVLTPIRVLVWDVVLPGDYFALVWDLIMLLVILYLCIILPYSVAFAMDFADLSNPLAQVDLAFSILFMVDCCLNFKTAYIGDDGKVVMQRGKIALHYLRGWFIFDIISSLPYEQMIHQGDHGIPTMSIVALLKIPRILRLIKVLRLLKMLRMARLTKLPALMSKVEWLLNRPMMQLATMCAAVCMLLHWIACIWYYSAMLGADGGWVTAAGLESTSEGHKYVAALYFAVSTVATVGFGDIVAVTLREKVVALITMLIGASVFGYFMGSMSVMVQSANGTRARMAAKRRAVDDFLTHRKVPRALADKVKSYYDYVVEREVQADEANIIEGLSASLRTQVVLHLYSEALEKVPFFRGQHPQFITSVVTALQLEYYAPGDLVVRQGDMGDAMYFLAQGSLEVRLYEDEDGSLLGRATFDHSPSKGIGATSGPCTPLKEQPEAEQQSTGNSSVSWMDRLLHRKRAPTQGTNGTTVAHEPGGEQDDGSVQLPESGDSAWTYEDELAQRPYRHLGYLHPGEYFGEYSCLLGQERSATVVASGYVELYSLSRSDLELVLQQWPELAEQFESMVEEAAGSLFPDQHVSSPLARWNIAKAVCTQQVSADMQRLSTLQEGPETVPQQHLSAEADAGAQQDKASERQPTSKPQQQAQGQRLPPAAASEQGSVSGGLPFLRDSSRSGGRSSFLGALFGGASGGSYSTMPSSPRPNGRPTLAGQLQQNILQHARSQPIHISVAPAAGPDARWSFDLAKQSNRFSDISRMSFVAAAPSLSDPAVFDFPSLAARSGSTISISNMSGVQSATPSVTGPPAAAGRAHRRSGSLTRASLPPGDKPHRNSNGSGGSANMTLSRASVPGPHGGFPPGDIRNLQNFQPRQGTGLFRTNSGQRYLFPGLRTGVLLQQPENEGSLEGPGEPGGQSHTSLTRRISAKRVSQ